MERYCGPLKSWMSGSAVPSSRKYICRREGERERERERGREGGRKEVRGREEGKHDKLT